MKKHFITILACCFSLMAESQPNAISTSFDKKTGEHLIVGQWQQTELSVTCDQIMGFNEAMNNPALRSSFKMLANGTSLQFGSGGEVISIMLSRTDTGRYQISDDGSVIYSNVKKKLFQKHKILELTSDTLIYTTNKKTKDPDQLQLLSALGLKKDTTKTVTYTYVFYKIKEANAPWTAIENNLPKKRWVDNLVANDSTLFTVVSDPYSESNDSIFASNDHGANWTYAGYASPKAEEQEIMIRKVGSKIFIATSTGFFATEKMSRSWVAIKALPAHTDSYFQKQFGATTSRIYVSVGDKLFASIDDGNTWDSVTTPLKPDDILMTLAVNATNIIIGGLDNNQPSGPDAFLLLSADEGHTWKNIQLVSEDYPGIMVNYAAIAGSSIFINTQYGMFRSDLQRINWIPMKGLDRPQANSGFSSLAPTGKAGEAMIASGTNLFYGGPGGMFLSDDGGQRWTEVNNKDLRKGVNSFVIANGQIIALTAGSKLFQASVNDLVQHTKKNDK